MTTRTNGNLAYKYQENNQYINQRKTKISKKKSSMPIGEKLFYIFSVLFVVTLSSIVISGYAQIAEYNYSIQKTKQSISELNLQTEHLQTEIADLSSPDRIIKIATDELGMSMNEEQIIVLTN